MDSVIHMVHHSSAGSNAMLVALWSASSPHRDPAISANPSGGASCWLCHSSCGDSPCWVGASDVLAAWVVTVGFEHPMPWAAVNLPLA